MIEVTSVAESGLVVTMCAAVLAELAKLAKLAELARPWLVTRMAARPRMSDRSQGQQRPWEQTGQRKEPEKVAEVPFCAFLRTKRLPRAPHPA